MFGLYENRNVSDLLNTMENREDSNVVLSTGYNDVEEYSEDYKITVEVRRKKMGTRKQKQNEDFISSLESVRLLDNLKFERLLDEYISSELRHGKEVIDVLIHLYEKDIISIGMIKKKANINYYELISKLAQKGSGILQDISQEEEEDIKDLRRLFKC